MAAKSKRSNSTKPAAALSAVSGYLQDEDGAEVFRLVNERVRLGILSALTVSSPMSFVELKSTLGVTDGNLSVHTRKLEDAAFLTCKKTFKGRRPHSEYTLTATGRLAFEHYLAHMEALINAMKETP